MYRDWMLYFLRLFFWIYRLFLKIGQTISTLPTAFGYSTSDYVGSSVDISEDGNSIAIGSLAANTAAIFDYNGSSWVLRSSIFGTGESSSQSGAGIFGNQCGYDVSLSYDANTVIIGCPRSGSYEQGDVRVYTYNNDINEFEQIGQFIQGDVPAGELGRYVNISAEGDYITYISRIRKDN